MSETTSRALELLNLLQTHRHWPGPELAERLGVTTRTLRRDIDRLRELGYRVTATRGAVGGYQLEAGSQLPPLLLNDDEAVAMAIGLRAFAANGIADGEQTALTALAKLEQLLPQQLRRRINALGDHLSTMRRDVPRVEPDLLGRLALVCRDHERVRFHYVARNGTESDRLVEPHSLVSSARYWFLLAWDVDRQDWRTFRVDRMTALFETRVRFAAHELPADDAAGYIEAAIASLMPVKKHADAVMRMPYDEVHARFGPWAEGATPEGSDRTRWPIGGERYEFMAGALAWIESGVEFELDADPEFVAFVRELAERMLRATDPVG